MRECGTCSACCRWPEIPELNKPKGVACPNLESCGFGCTIYFERPKPCSDYKCSWLEGYGGPNDRPDDCGVVVDRRMTEYGPMLVARDLGGPDQPKKKAIKRIARDLNMACFLVDDSDAERILFIRGPKGAMEELLEKHPELRSLV